MSMFRKGQQARKEWKMRTMSANSELTRKQYIRLMMEAEQYSFGCQLELDKKRSKKKEDNSSTLSGT